MKKWYEIKAKINNAAEIFLYDEIGAFGISAKNFIDELKALGEIKSLTVRINSIGGDLFDGLTIHNVLARHPAEVTVWIDGIAASIASVIAMAGNKVIMPDNAFMMIHRSWGAVVGNAEDMREWAEIMEKFDKSIILAYQKKSPRSAEEIEHLMREESWLTAAEAKEWGFADEISEAVKLAARATFEKFKNLPEPLRGLPILGRQLQNDPPEPDPSPSPQPPVSPSTEEIRAAAVEEGRRAAVEKAARRATEVYQICSDAGVPDLAAELLEKGMGAEDARTRLAEAGAIRSICAAAAMPKLADSWIKAGVPLEACRQKLFQMSLALGGPEIDNKHLGLIGSGEIRTVLDPAEIYASRRRGLTNGAGK